MLFRTIAKFEKVSYEQFFEDFVKAFNLSETRELEDGTHEIIDLHPIVTKVYDSIKLPKRATMGSAGYDFFVPIDLDIVPNTTVKIPTGIRCYIEDGYFLSLYPRSSLGFKFQMALANTVGIIDADYYNSSNEGHIICGIVNHGDRIISIRKGDRFCQGIFLPYLLAEEDEVLGKRDGGFGSSGS